jgi:hypothetical protein
MNRLISFGAKITLNYKPVRGLGVREIVLIGLAAAQAVYLIFMATGMVLAARLGVALFLAIGLLAFAILPIRGHTIEHFILIALRGIVRPRRYLHQTSTRGFTAAPEDQTCDAPAQVAARAAAPAAAPARRAIRRPLVPQGEWSGPNLALVMAVFCVLLFAGSVIAYAAQSGVAQSSHATGVIWR